MVSQTVKHVCDLMGFEPQVSDRKPPVPYYLIVCCVSVLFCFEIMVSDDLR